jgi:predicted N-acetyltransferase YhbS
VIRIGTEDDAAEIARVINAAFQVEHAYRKGERTTAANVRELMQRDIFLVAEEESNLVGAVYVRVRETVGYFGMLAVDPARQRSGIGRALREAAEQYSRDHGCTVMTLTTGDFRQDLIPYYEKFGYKVVGTEPAAADAPFTQAITIIKMSKML